ncbi:BMP family ABC transporter substrate-binding protein [Actinobaculum sp. 352]|nr:BMP family ABC transporter substrate-binding protein [Actinobaculum sp. 313]RTE50693.1 BMP family ABC transporter substrate-binding protein [Actinobaculum sp. 352]
MNCRVGYVHQRRTRRRFRHTHQEKSVNKTKLAAILGAAALALSACGGNSSDNKSSNGGDGGNKAGSDYTACLVSDAGGWNDKSFNQSAKEGLERAVEELGVAEKTAESKSSADFQPNVDSLVDSGCDLVIGVGFNLNDAISRAAKNNENVSFALIDDQFKDPLANERALVFNTQEAAYLAGYSAAAMTKTGKVATFGGIQIPSVTIFMDGFVDGVARYNADHGTNVEVKGWDKEAQTGQFTNTFDDQSKGTETAQQLINQGADIIMPVAGPVGLGAAAAAQTEGDVLIIGVDSDWYESAPNYKDIILTSVQKDIGSAVFDTVQAGSEGNFTADNYLGTLENGGVKLAPFHDFESELPEGLQDELDAIQEEIITGKTVVESDAAFEK